MVKYLFFFKGQKVCADGRDLARGQSGHQKLGKPRTRRARTSTLGQSLMEILIAVAVGVIMIGAAAVVIVPALKTNVEVNEAKVGAELGRALFENARVLIENDWPSAYNLGRGLTSTYYITSTPSFVHVTGTEAILVATTTYGRYFYFEDVCRKWGGTTFDFDSCTSTDPTVALDPSTLKLTVAYYWEPENATKTFGSYLTRFKSRVLSQTDWSGGAFQEGPIATSNNRFATSSNIDFSTTSPGSILLIFEE